MPSIPPPPFAKGAPHTQENVRALDAWLTTITAYHPLTADRPWLFYEQIDLFLGPWGKDGYPIAYGLKYCHLFYENRTLKRDPAGARWIQRTLLFLQMELHLYIIRRFKEGTLGRITAEELRTAAFNSHPKAYTEGGLTLVVLIAPELVAAVAAIPNGEFKPTSPSFGPSVQQVVDTTGIVIPQLVANLLAIAAGPAHNQTLSVASARDGAAFQEDRAVSLKLATIRNFVKAGRCDHLDLLERIRQALEVTTFADETADRVAGGVVDEIEKRMLYVNVRYQRESVRDRDLRDVFQEFDEDACVWRP
jgi:hypothetical protein